MNTDSMFARQLSGAITTLDIKVPKAVTDAYADTERVINEAQHLAGPRDGLGAAVAAALFAGNDPEADPVVQRIVTSTAIGNEGIARQVQDIAFDRYREAVIEHNEAIVKAFRKPFDTAATSLTEAHTRIGDIALDDTAAILIKGNDIAEVWAKARTANKAIGDIVIAWAALGEFTRIAPADQNHRILRLANPDFATWEERSLTGMKLDAWGCLLAGLTLELPTFAEYRERRAHIAAEKQRVSFELQSAATGIAAGKRDLSALMR